MPSNDTFVTNKLLHNQSTISGTRNSIKSDDYLLARNQCSGDLVMMNIMPPCHHIKLDHDPRSLIGHLGFI